MDLENAIAIALNATRSNRKFAIHTVRLLTLRSSAGAMLLLPLPCALKGYLCASNAR